MPDGPLLTPDAMRRLGDLMRALADTTTDPRRAKKFLRRAAWWDDQATLVEERIAKAILERQD